MQVVRVELGLYSYLVLNPNLALSYQGNISVIQKLSLKTFFNFYIFIYIFSFIPYLTLKAGN